MDVEAALKEARNIDGAIGVTLADRESGMSLGANGGGKYLDLDVAAAGNTEVVRAKMRAASDPATHGHGGPSRPPPTFQ